jgi:hypothetical protein
MGKHKVFIFSIKELILLSSRMKIVTVWKNILLRFWFWVEVFAALAVSLRQGAFLVEDGEGPHMWRAFVNIFNKQSRTADKGRSSRLGLREGLTNPHHKGNHVTKCYTACMDSLKGPKERKMDMTFGTWNIRFMSLFRAVFWVILPLYCSITQKTALNIILAAVRTWNLTGLCLLVAAVQICGLTP